MAGKYAAIPDLFRTGQESEYERAYNEAMRAMRDPRSDEAQLLAEAVLDDISDLQEMLATIDRTNYCDVGFKLLVLRNKHAERVARDAAEQAAEQVPAEGPHAYYGVSRRDFA